MKNKMIYEYNVHGLYYENKFGAGCFTLTIGFLQLDFDFKSGKFSRVYGYLPLDQEAKCEIQLPDWKEGEYYLKDTGCESDMAYDFTQIVPETINYFGSGRVDFDRTKGVIFLGSKISEKEKGIRIDDNILLGFDEEGILKCIYIIPDCFI